MLHADFGNLLGQVRRHGIERRGGCGAGNSQLGQLGDVGLYLFLLPPCVAGVQEVLDLDFSGGAVGKFEAQSRHVLSILCVSCSRNLQTGNRKRSPMYIQYA
ncbi:hypothetical protein D9M72_454590 [compost metagenome]